MKTHIQTTLTTSLLVAAGLVACSSNPMPPPVGRDAGPDTPTPTDNPPPTDNPTPTDMPAPTGLCGMYCNTIMTNCTGMNAQYDNMADCLAYCAQARWPEGAPGAMSGNNVNCRIYHGGAPAMMAPGTHCPHAGPSGDGVCGSTLMFRTDAPAGYVRVDRMGMPAVSTALVGSARKNAYNDVNGRAEMAGFVPDFVMSLTGLHTALDRHLMAAGLTPCSMTTMVNGLPECLGQSLGSNPMGPTVASLVVPDDALTIDPSAESGFPNGRRLQDPVIDVTLAVLLLRLRASCGPGTCSPTTLAGIPLNPRANDRPFLTTFPYLAAAQTP